MQGYTLNVPYQYFDQIWRIVRIANRKAYVQQFHGKDQFTGREIWGDSHQWHVDDLKPLRLIAK